MSHRSVVALLEDTAKSLGDNIQFGYGRRSDFNLITNKRYTFIWAAELNASVSFAVNNTHNYQKRWNVTIYFSELDKPGSVETEYVVILNDLDILIDMFLNRLNDWSMKTTDTVGQITIQNINQRTNIKKDADITTGWIISFQLVTPDDFVYCTPDNIELYAGNN